MTSPFTTVADVFCFVPDLAAATAWYTDRLGVPPALRAIRWHASIWVRAA